MTTTVMLGAHHVVVDECDLALVRRYGWHVRPNGYVVRFVRSGGRPRTVYLHREIMGAATGEEVDHIDGDPRNNARSNLRLCTRTENGRNTRGSRNGTSRFKGVSFEAWTGKWRAIIHVGPRHINLGRFTDESAAAIAYDEAARKYFGEFARLNFPDEDQERATAESAAA